MITKQVPYSIMSTIKSDREKQSSSAWRYKYFGILFLTIQQASMPLMARSARYRNEKDVFFTSVNVLIMDLIKLFMSAAIIISNEKSIAGFFRLCIIEIFGDPVETLKICVPSFIYMVQNNLYYIALSNLESTTFCVLYQMKILTTAIMLRFVLSKPLSRVQWMALVILIIGVADVQMQYQPPNDANKVEQRPWVGFAAVFTMCFTSAVAGVYMEKALKQSSSSVWMQNVRLALFGIGMSCCFIVYQDYTEIKQYGMFRGFDFLVWVMTFTNSVGGLLISIVMKYADNILKAYAQSVAIVGAALGSWLLFDFVPNTLFLLGMIFVIVSICMYTMFPSRPKQERKIKFWEEKC
ncbi:UDP-galactose translocator [Aphelenchoides bicaudatus]|nr:UDP-galactose translocator [Aphelenchoides bicaudatus]